MSEFKWTDFNASAVETPSHDPIPAGEYVAIITASEMKDTKAGTGQYLELTFQIAEGEHEGRFAWARLNLVNPSEKAVQIALADLAAICKAIGIMQPKESSELHDKPLIIRIAVKKDGDGNPRSEIKGYKPAAAAQQKPVAQSAPAPSKPSVPPWKRK